MPQSKKKLTAMDIAQCQSLTNLNVDFEAIWKVLKVTIETIMTNQAPGTYTLQV